MCQICIDNPDYPWDWPQLFPTDESGVPCIAHKCSYADIAAFRLQGRLDAEHYERVMKFKKHEDKRDSEKQEATKEAKQNAG